MSKDSTNHNPAVDVAKNKYKTGDTLTLPDGVRIKIVPVSAGLMDEVTRQIKDPPVPLVYNKDDEQSLPNPGAPEYLLAMEEARQKRTRAAMDALALFGVDLLDPLPQDGAWLKKLKYLEKLGNLDLSQFDLSDPLELEFIYKRYIVCSGDVLKLISEASGVSGVDIEAAEAAFRGKEAG